MRDVGARLKLVKFLLRKGQHTSASALLGLRMGFWSGRGNNGPEVVPTNRTGYFLEICELFYIQILF
jgi:hypothetical protein